MTHSPVHQAFHDPTISLNLCCRQGNAQDYIWSYRFLVTFYISEISVAIAVEVLCTTAPPNPSLCSNDYKNTIAQACINVVTDFAVLGFPITKVFNLQMPLQRKIRVSAIFGVGLL